MKGTNVFKEYYLDNAKTKDALDGDGWYHTGDIGSFDKCGRLKILGRLQSMFKIPQGEFIIPEKIENIYLRCPLINQIFVYGNIFNKSLVAIVVPEEKAVEIWCQKNNFNFNLKEICKNLHFKNALIQFMNGTGKEGNLKSLEQIKDIYVHDELFSVENKLLTNNMQSNRYELTEFFKAHIKEMYLNL